MASAIQWTIDKFWGQLQSLQGQINQVESALQANKAKLQQMYTIAKANNDPRRDTAIAPLIHRNTVLRLTYLKPIKDKFREAVNAASSALRGAGYTTPGLGDMGFAIVIAPAAAVTLVLAALAAVTIVWRLTQAQITRTNSMAAIFADPSTTVEQKLALSKQQAAQVDQENRSTPPPIGFNVQDLIPLAGIVAVIVLGPQILSMIPKRKASA